MGGMTLEPDLVQSRSIGGHRGGDCGISGESKGKEIENKGRFGACYMVPLKRSGG